ncbi:endonuclease domain-containing 1 protein [Brachionichthys hirsutus]|uniref:endonuclease domain-containing 1 protein n=1 Tax=Brachionichthys hirsutus TaxID=412623 RepID=UPI0036044A30
MLHPTVGAAAAAICMLAVLGPGPSLSAKDNSETVFSLCRHCFYNQMPPRAASAGSGLRPLCHKLPGGQAFATLSKPGCDRAVYAAFCLSHGWLGREAEEEGELGTVEEDESITVAAPALLGRGGVPSTDSLVQTWDSAVTALVKSSIAPQCGTSEGDLYILTGAGDLSAAEDGGGECQTRLLWSAVCCAVSEGQNGFSVGLIREAGKPVKQVSVKELEEMLGVEEMFLEGCGRTDEETVVGLLEGQLGNPEELVGDPSGSTDSNLVHDVEAEEAGADPQPKEADVVETSASNAEGESPESSDAAVDEQEIEANSSSTVVYALSTVLSILKAPLRPVFSTITQLPGQVTYVLQKDLGVLATVPGDTCSVLYLLTSDILSWMGSAAEMLLGIGESCFFGTYYCTSSMMGALMNSCYTGVTGMGTLAGDSLGIFGNVLDNGWWVTKVFGGRLWEQSEGYVGSVMWEMGGQVKSVGGGFGSLAWRSGNGVFNVFRVGGGLTVGMASMVIGAVSEAFGQESESWTESSTPLDE